MRHACSIYFTKGIRRLWTCFVLLWLLATTTTSLSTSSPAASDSNFQETMSSSTRLRQFFPDNTTVKIYPDDFIREDGTVETNIVFPELVDRRQGHFSDHRQVVFVRPGTYTVNFPVGYWTQILGLGETPDQVTFQGSLGVYALPANMDNPKVGSLDTFWRSAENFQMNTSFLQNDKGEWCVPRIVGEDVNRSLIPNEHGKFTSLYPIFDLSKAYPQEDAYDPSKGMMWAVSQAAPLRRIHVNGNLHLSLGDNYASGGFIGNVNITGYLMMGSQQQFCVRNTHVDQKLNGGAWSMVFVGSNTKNNNTDNNNIAWVGPSPHVSSEPTTSVRIEKPFIFVEKDNDDDNDYKVYLAIPQLQNDSSGVDYQNHVKVEIDNLKHVRVFTPKDSFAQVQMAATNGAHIILSPGIYNWGDTLEISHSNQVVLGLGLATIQAPGTGKPCIHVASEAHGVRLSGLSLEANVISKFVYEGSTLLEWGEAGRKGGSKDNPGAIHDLYCFVGGRRLERTVQVQTMVKIYSNHVVGDNLWLWRADHVQLMQNEQPNKPELSEYHVTTFGECRCDTGLEVFGDYVTFVGLAIEHTYKDMLIWHGQYGSVYFYQSEMPYDVPGDVYRDITGYRVHGQHHTAKGVGVYSYFRDYDNVVVDSAVAHHALGGNYENVFAVWLNGFSGIRSIMNGQGGDTTMPGKPFVIAEFSSDGIFSSYFWKGIWKQTVG